MNVFLSILLFSSLAVAKSALRDGLWQVARAEAEADGSDEARLVILESYASEDRWDQVEAELAKGGSVTNTPAYGYYRAVIDGHFEDAVAKLRESGSEAGAAEAKMLEADLQLKRGNSAAAKELWTEVIAMTNVSDRAMAIAGMNLGNEKIMRDMYSKTISLPMKRRIGLKLGQKLVASKDSMGEGAKLVRAIVFDAPDTEGAKEALIDVGEAYLREKQWKEAVKTYADAIEIWIDIAKRADVQEGRGEAFFRLGRKEEALEAFTLAETLSEDELRKARAVLRQGDVLSELGRGDEAMARYRHVLEKYPTTETAISLKRLVGLRELEMRGRDLYRSYSFEEAREAFREVAEEDPTRKARMTFLEALCLYGLGSDAEACALAKTLSESCEDISIKTDAMLWLAKFAYNHCEWREASQRFTAFAEINPQDDDAPSALLWATRAAFAANDFVGAIQIATRLSSAYPESSAVVPALLIQSEALIEQARFDEVVLVLDRIASDAKTARGDRQRARLLRADALFAMGADNAIRYESALEAYRAIKNGEELSADMQLSVSFKIGRVLEKLKRTDEAVSQYYVNVVCAYSDGRQRGETFGDDARATFVRAAFRLADIHEDRGRLESAVHVLRLVVSSGVPAAEEASRRIRKISSKGLFL